MEESLIVHVIRHGPQWNDARQTCGPHNALGNRFIGWSGREDG
jgi:hypothetical protein